MQACNGWHLISGWPLLVCQVWVFLGESVSIFTRETSWFFTEADEKHWIKPIKWRGTACSCTGGNILHYAPSLGSSGHCSLWLKMRKAKTEMGLPWSQSTSQLKTFLGMVSIFYVSCANSTSNWPKLCLNMPTVGLWLWIRQVEKGLTPPKWVKWRPITPTTRNPVRLRGLQSNQYRHLEKFPKERKHASVCLSSPCLRTLVTSSVLRWTTQAKDYKIKTNHKMLGNLIPWVLLANIHRSTDEGKTKQDPDTEKLSKFIYG